MGIDMGHTEQVHPRYGEQVIVQQVNSLLIICINLEDTCDMLGICVAGISNAAQPPSVK